MTSYAIIPGGDDPGSAVLYRSREADVIIAADSGLDHARRHGVEPDLLVGDLDSVDPGSGAAFSGEIQRHSPDKDKTDLELAIDVALERRATSVEILGGGGGRFDHLLANCVVITSPRLVDVDLRWVLSDTVVTVITDSRSLNIGDGSIVTLLAMGGDATGVSLSGVRWPLDEVVLPYGSSWGVSNEITSQSAKVSIDSGTMIAIQTRAS